MKRVIIVHGWGGKSDVGWMGWLNNELTARGFEVIAKRMPNPDYPKIEDWVDYLKKIAGRVDEDTYFVGHSIGCQAILRYLENLSDNKKVGGVFFVAGWFHLDNLKTEEEKEVAKSWLETPINFYKIKPKVQKIFALFSDNDPWVPVSDSKIFKQKLGAEVIIEKGRGHYIESETKEIPILLKKILEIAK